MIGVHLPWQFDGVVGMDKEGGAKEGGVEDRRTGVGLQVPRCLVVGFIRSFFVSLFVPFVWSQSLVPHFICISIDLFGSVSLFLHSISPKLLVSFDPVDPVINLTRFLTSSILRFIVQSSL
jgi:hypothetical protein